MIQSITLEPELGVTSSDVQYEAIKLSLMYPDAVINIHHNSREISYLSGALIRDEKSTPLWECDTDEIPF